MTTIDVEALLESTAKPNTDRLRSEVSDTETARTSGSRRARSPSASRASSRHPSRSRSRDGSRDRRRRRSRESDRSRRHRDEYRRRSRSRSPRGGGRRRRRDEYRSRRDRGGDRYTGGGERRRDDDRRSRDADAAPNEDERDRRTVFVQQLAARLRTRELKEFFEKVGGVVEAQIVKDRISGRSKGVGYVEFKAEETVAKALQLTGQKLLGIPIIVQVTEAEKNRQARNPEAATTGNHPSQVPFHRLYVGNIHFNVTEQDLLTIFEPFGELEFVQLQKDENGRSRGYGFVQYRNADNAREALEKMNGFDLAGRLIRVGLGNDKFTPESTANMMQKFSGNGPNQQTRSGPNVFDRASRRDNDKPVNGTVSALDDTDVGGVNFNNYSRDALMRKLARTDEALANNVNGNDERQIMKPKTETKPLPVVVNQASRCVVLRNMFDPEEEEGEDWVKELEDDVRQEAENKYGHVVHIAVDANSKGDIYIKFDKVQGGENAIKGLNGRYFGGRMIDASPVVDTVYSSLFSRTRAI